MSEHSPEIAGVGRSEFETRVARARAAAAERGLDGVVVIGRGGGPFERHGNLAYLTGHYPTFPAIPDRAPFWRLRGHAAVVIGDGRTLLLTDDHLGEGSAVADEIRSTADLPAAIGAAARDAGLAGRRIGLVGTDVLDAVHLAQVEEALGGEVTAADDLLVPARMVKSPAEQELLRRAGAVGSAAITAGVDAALGGANEQEAAAEAVRVAMTRGAAIANTFTGVYGPGRPPRRHLYPSYADDAAVRPGDVFVIDMSGALDGYFFDFARSAVVGADAHGGEDAIALAREVVEATVACLRPGATVADAVAAGRAVMERAGDEADEGGFAALGHGLGLGFEDPWLVAGDETVLEPGMCIAVERFVVRGDVCASFEHDVLVTAGAPEILSVARESWRSSPAR